MITSIFVNLPIENLKRSVDFFTGLGFTFNEQFTSEDSTCMIINEHIYVMLLERARFAGFIEKEIAPRDTAEAILSFGVESREEVTALAEKAFALGARKVNEAQDLGFMFSWAFEDLDGHLWDLFWMDPNHVLPTE
jgi:predicted lactoylglutathione lyase